MKILEIGDDVCQSRNINKISDPCQSLHFHVYNPTKTVVLLELFFNPTGITTNTNKKRLK
jgi:hypothetical protein